MKILLVILMCTLCLKAAAEGFPLREKYPSVDVISTGDLYTYLEDYTVIDVRSKLEFEVIHVNGSAHVPVSKATFISKLNELTKNDKSMKIAFYCNGHTCAKSYKAVVAAQKAGYTNTKCFDAGIFDWATTYPKSTTLLGNTPIGKGKLISKAEFKKRLLPADVFRSQVQSSDAIVFDIRDPVQRSFIPDYSKFVSSIPFSRFVRNLKLKIFQEKVKGKTLYIIDAVGKQVRWLQYHIEANGIKDYYFLKSGVKGLKENKGA